jgi:hypothetical protein
MTHGSGFELRPSNLWSHDVHPRHFFRNPVDVGAAKYLDRRVTMIARSDPEAEPSPDPAPGNDQAPAEQDQVERDQASGDSFSSTR